MKKVVASIDPDCARELKPIVVRQPRCGYYETVSTENTEADLEELCPSSVRGTDWMVPGAS